MAAASQIAPHVPTTRELGREIHSQLQTQDPIVNENIPPNRIRSYAKSVNPPSQTQHLHTLECTNLNDAEHTKENANGLVDRCDAFGGLSIGGEPGDDRSIDGYDHNISFSYASTETSKTPNGQVPIAICGMAFRLPGGLTTPQQLWEFLLAKGDARARVPDSRYKISSFYEPDVKPGTVISEYGYFIKDDISRLDTSFFNMARREVERLDPQQRLMLEVARECFEDAGVVDWRGKPIGCYMGSLFEDWCEMFARETQNYGNYRVTGYGDFALSNRVSYEMNLQGPSMTIRTACSASLVALHEACVAISRGDCESAIVGGTNLIMNPGATMSMTEQGVLSPDGSCKTFSADANGYARGEAIDAIYIKPLDEALRDRNPIRAVIRGTATNHDGKTPGITVPNADAQEALMRRAYQIAGIENFSQTGYVECHGTGTPVGDPIEAKAVGRVFGEYGTYIGSIKPNLGHTEGASGLISVIKAILALENLTIPPNIKFSSPNPAIPFESAKLTVPIDPVPWPKDRSQRVSVNSFGVTGSNAHVIIDSAANFNLSTAADQVPEAPRLLLFSANSQSSLMEMIDNYSGYIEANSLNMNDLAYTLANSREHLPYRTYSIASQGCMGTTCPINKAAQTPALVMVFTGQGAQWPQMSRKLLDTNDTFLQSIRSLDTYLQATVKHISDWSIERELRKPDKRSRVHSAEFSQPLCTAIQLALVDTFSALKIYPSAVVGHSSGEIAAAYAARALTAEEAIMCAVHRGAVMNSQKRIGAMAAIGMGWKGTEKFLAPGTTLACYNSPNSVTISGDTEGVEAVITGISKCEPTVLTKKLKVDKAYHSHHMKDIGEKYHSLICEALKAREPTTPFFSSVTGGLFTSGSIDSKYWQKNLESPVLFEQAVESILKHPVGKNAVFLEIGPHSALAGPLRQILMYNSNTAPYVSAMARNRNCAESFLAAVGKLWTLRTAVDLKSLNPNGVCLHSLPTYPWDHGESYWYESRLSKEYRQRAYAYHDLLGVKQPESTDLEPSWRNLFHLDNAPWIRDHKVGDDIVFPFAGYIAMAGEAVTQTCGPDETFHLRHIIVSSALVVNEAKPTEMITTLRKHHLTDTFASEWWEFSIASHNGLTWTRNCTGEVMAQTESLPSPEMPQTHARKVDFRRWVNALRATGLDLGPSFNNLIDISCDTRAKQAAAKVLNQKSLDADKYHLHPTVIDSALQMVGIASANGRCRAQKHQLPTSCDNISISRSSKNFVVQASTDALGSSTLADIQGFVDGVIVLSMAGLKLSPAHTFSSTGKSSSHATARQEWAPDIDFIDPTDLVKPSIQHSLYTSTLDEITQLCLLHSQKYGDTVAPEKSPLQRHKQWADDRLATFDMSSFQSLDKVELSERIDQLADSLANTPASCAASALQSTHENLSDIYSGQTQSWETYVSSKTIIDFYDFVYHWDDSILIHRLEHYKPNMSVLQICSTSSPSTRILDNPMRSGRPARYSRHTFAFKGFAAVQEDRVKIPNVDYATLDINEDPLEQGFEPHTYDLIVLSNVFYTARKIGASLQNLRRLLRPSGYLVLQQPNPSSMWMNYIFGLHAGWWRTLASDNDNKISTDFNKWREELAQAGYDSLHAKMLGSQDSAQPSIITVVKPLITHCPTKHISLLSVDSTKYPGPVLEELESRGYNVVQCTIRDEPPAGRDVLSLLDVDGPFMENVESDPFDSLKTFVKKLDNSGMLWITRPSQQHCQDPRYAQIIGFARTMRSELLVEYATCEVADPDASAAQIAQVFNKFHQRNTGDGVKQDLEYSICDGTINIPRFYPFALDDELLFKESDDRVALDIEIPGHLNSMHWAWRPAPPPLQADQVEVEMHAVGLNFRDVLVARKIVELPKLILGLEGSGVVRQVGPDVKALRPGDRVAMIERGVFSTTVVTLEELCIKIPDDLSLREASTMFFPFVTAMHSLITVGGLQKGQTVLIHSACGGVGLAAVQLAQMIEADVFVTVGSDDKVKYIMDTFHIPKSRIVNSRDDSFEKGIMHETQGTGVDIALNSLSGELLHATWRCIAPFGKMIEIGKRDLIGFGKLDMNPFLANRSYCCVDVDAFRDRPDVRARLLKPVVDLYQQGHISPIRPTKAFDAASTGEAFLYMQKGQHIGRICITMRNDLEQSQLPTNILKRPRALELKDAASYLLVGGLGGLGRSVATWLAEHGARHLIFLSRNAGADPNDDVFVNELKSMGCHAQLVPGSVTNIEVVSRAIAQARHPLKGVIQMSMVLRDGHFANMTLEQWNAAVEPKVQGTWNLHHATVAAHSELDFFVLLSSLSGIVGQPGQANYAAANTFLDAFVQYRNSQGFPASVIDIGAIGDVGYLSNNADLLQKMADTGFKPLKEQEVLDALLLSIVTSKVPPSRSTSDSVYTPPHTFVLGLASTTPLERPSNRAVWRTDPRMAVYNNTSASTTDASTSKASLKKYIAMARSNVAILREPEAKSFFAKEIGERLFELLMRPAEDLNMSLSLADLGMDSLVGIELCAWWKQTFGFGISVLEMLGKGTLEALGQHAAEGLIQSVSAGQGG